MHQASTQPDEITLSVVVIRADGTREDLGVVAEYYRNPLRRWLRRARKTAKRKA